MKSHKSTKATGAAKGSPAKPSQPKSSTVTKAGVAKIVSPANAMRVAADIMTKEPYVLRSSMTIDEVTKEFLLHNFTSAPVMGSTEEVLGMLDEFALIKVKLSQQLDSQVKSKMAFHIGVLQDARFVKEMTPLLDVVKEMIKSPTHRILVMNNAQQLVGIISPKDVLRYIAGERQKSLDLKAELAKTKSELYQAKSALMKTKSRLDIYKDMVMDSPTMIHSVDESGKIIMANKKMHQNLGYSYGEMIGKSIFELYFEAVHQDALMGLKKIMDEGEHHHVFTTMLKKNGDPLRVDVASTALVDEGDKFVGTISVSREVDADTLLESLHAVLDQDGGSESKFNQIQSLLKEKVKTKPKSKL